MVPRHLILLSPYCFPAHIPLTLADEDMAAWLSGYTALWDPSALWQATGPPQVAVPYEHETPQPNHVYALPATPRSLLPGDWEEKVRAAGATFFQATPDRGETLANLKAALGSGSETPLSSAAPFFGIGFGFLLLAALSDAMEHENLLDKEGFWQVLQQAVACANDSPGQLPAEALERLRSAATRLLQARESLYPVTIHLLDLLLLEEQDLNDPWPVTVEGGQPVNVFAPSAVLERLKEQNPGAVASLANAIQAELAEVCGGDYMEREDALMPIESQLWNLGKGLATAREILGSEVRVYARRRFGAHTQLPAWLNQHGINRAVLLPGPGGSLPAYSCPVMNWSTADGQDLACFMRRPLPTDSVEIFFNLGHHLFKTTREDQTATLAFVHGRRPALPWYADLLQLTQLAEVPGKWTTFSHYFTEAAAGEYAGALGPDDFHFDYLSQRSPFAGAGMSNAAPAAAPVSGFARQLRWRRRLDSCWTLAAMQRGLVGRNDPLRIEKQLQAIENRLETAGANQAPEETLDELTKLEVQIATALGDRLLARAQEHRNGYLLLNPCSFSRRLALELDANGSTLSLSDLVKAAQVDGEKLRVVAEMPGLGFAWLPLTTNGSADSSQAATQVQPGSRSRVRLADERCVRNEYFEAEIDTVTGGLKAIRDHKMPVNRISQRLIFRPGSVMTASQVKTTSVGPALGEIVAEGNLLDAQNQVLAKFRQRYRAWLGRPILEIRIELFPQLAPSGDPWSAYYGAQFAWRDERALLLRGFGGMGHVTTQARPQTPDFLEIRLGRQSTTIFPAGLPFHQREGGRMLDVILAPPGEKSQVFDLAIGLDREQPMQTALGLATPAIVVPTTKGPPHIGDRGWLFHLDAPNLLLTSMRPGNPSPWTVNPSDESVASGGQVEGAMDAITARILECSGFSTPAELRCPRDPKRVLILDSRGQPVMDGTQTGDAALFHVGPGGFLQLQVQFSE